MPHNIAEQSAIANVLTTMDNEIESLEEERDKYIQVKEGMKQKLLTGQIRLVETEAKVVAMPKAKVANVHFKRSVLAAEPAKNAALTNWISPYFLRKILKIIRTYSPGRRRYRVLPSA